MFDICIYGLGVMGSSLAKNLLKKEESVALFSISEEERKQFVYKGASDQWRVFSDQKELLSSLKSPRILFLMITSGTPVDHVITSLLPNLSKGDVIIDGGNSHYLDTSRRVDSCKKVGVHFLGIGVSGGEKGALEGPSMMVGGSKKGWETSKNILQKISAQFQGEPCSKYLGPGGVGHHVKMVHNGIEYAIIQLIADTYMIMRDGLKLTHNSIIDTFIQWQHSELKSYLIDITVQVLSKVDEDGTYLIDKIVDVAKQKGTGSWTVEESLKRGVYVPTISEAVYARYFSANPKLRMVGNEVLKATINTIELDDYQKQLKEALLSGMICSYAQGLELIQKASLEEDWDIDLKQVISLWRSGCIITSELLEDILISLQENESNIILTNTLSYISELEPSLREVVIQSQGSGLAVPTLISTLNYYDSYRAKRLSVNMVQGLRDCFGSHGYERIDKEGSFHTQWE